MQICECAATTQIDHKEFEERFININLDGESLNKHVDVERSKFHLNEWTFNLKGFIRKLARISKRNTSTYNQLLYKTSNRNQRDRKEKIILSLWQRILTTFITCK